MILFDKKGFILDRSDTWAESSFLMPLVSPRSWEYTFDSRTRMLLLVPCKCVHVLWAMDEHSHEAQVHVMRSIYNRAVWSVLAADLFAWRNVKMT